MQGKGLTCPTIHPLDVSKWEKMEMRIGILLLVVVVSACVDKNPLETFGENELEGEWQLKGQKIGYGPPGEWEDVENGKIIGFGSESFNGLDYFNSCDTGTYELKVDELILNYSCSSQSEPFVYHIILEGSAMIISPRTVICNEGCEYKFVKR